MLFALIALTVWLVMHLYIGWSLLGSMRPARWVRWAVVAALATHFVVSMTGMGVGRAVPQIAEMDWLQWVTFVGMGAFVLLFAGVLLRDLIRLGIWAWARVRARSGHADRAAETPAEAPADPSRRELFARTANASIVGATVVATATGYHQARRLPDVERVDVPVTGLHPDLDGLQIVQLSDIHVGPTIKGDFLDAVVDRVAELDADLVAITGDLVDGYPDRMGHELAGLRRLGAELRGRLGSFFVTGNHEYYWGPDSWCDFVAGCGVDVLNNDHRVVEVGQARLVVGGVTDYSSQRHLGEANGSRPKRAARTAYQASDPHAALAGAPGDADFRLLLAHQPKSIDAAAEAGWDLQLSGHTHGGQFWPWNLLVGLAHPFTAGLHRQGDTHIYVSRGTGYWGPPLRLGAPSEITVLTLRRA